ncbi:hypothetical protein A6770_39965 [Nostoc minutum NIES-26]|uniref:RNA polymerase subunit sigma n=1 Tax=Nostoc minutum NIES-26 TaxID=1844469 RepID=A0A367RRP8_9NOSO|nr:hypothetical protein A6770_39965 [Nostoc minutum NIES-26]
MKRKNHKIESPDYSRVIIANNLDSFIFAKLGCSQRELSLTLGRPATITEIAETINAQPSQIREYLNAFRQPVSLDLRVGEERDTQLQEILPDQSISPEESIVQELFQEDLNNWLGLLTPIQREVIMLRFGFGNERKLTTKQVAQQLNIKPAKVNHIQQQAIKLLRHEQDQLKDYWVC